MKASNAFTPDPNDTMQMIRYALPPFYYFRMMQRWGRDWESVQHEFMFEIWRYSVSISFRRFVARSR